MTEDILLNISPTETRVAVVENGIVQEVLVERAFSRGIVGNIYKGRVLRVLPGMQAAFVDIGLDRAAFIHAGDISGRDEETPESITSLLHESQSLIIQVTKDPIGSKGARLATQLSIPSRYLVYMPHIAHVGVSLKIEDDTERERLKALVEQAMLDEGMPDGSGFILRTAAEGAGVEEVIADIRYLKRLWAQISIQMAEAPAPSVLYEDLDLSLRTFRDLVTPRTERVRVDSRETYGRAALFLKDMMPEFLNRLEYYPGERPIFDLYAVEDEMEKALDRKVQLKSGGYLIIDQTEAMTVIDVNTGAFVGHRTLEETIFKTNLEAATAIARQLRLRNIGGIIIIDFIDMEDVQHQQQVLRTLERQQERDHSRSHILGMTELGLVQMTRKRTRESLSQILCEPCSHCNGKGLLKTAQTVCYEIFREILREARAYQAKGYMVLADQNVVERMIDEESANVANLESFIRSPIQFQVESSYTQEQYDVVLL